MRFRAVEFFQTRQYTRIMHAHYTHIYASTDVHTTSVCTQVAPKKHARVIYSRWHNMTVQFDEVIKITIVHNKFLWRLKRQIFDPKNFVPM